MLWTFSSAVSKTGGGRGESQGQDLGALPQSPLRGLLKEKSPKNLQDLQLRGLLIYPYVVQILSIAVFRATNSGCSCYRIEMVGKLHLNRAERHAGRSVSVNRYFATNGLHPTSILYSKSSRMSRGRNRGGEKNAGLRSAPRPRLLEKGLKIQNFPHKDLPCNAGRSLWGKFLGSRGDSCKSNCQ